MVIQGVNRFHMIREFRFVWLVCYPVIRVSFVYLMFYMVRFISQYYINAILDEAFGIIVFNASNFVVELAML